MKINKHILTSILFGLISSISHAQPRPLMMQADEWCPFNCKPDSDAPGFLVELGQKIFTPLGYTVSYSIVPWNRAIENVRSGQADILVASNHEETPDFIFPTKPDLFCGFSAFTLKDEAFAFTDSTSLGQRRLGAIDGYFYSPDMDAYIKANRNAGDKVQILTGDDDVLARNIKKLLLNRIDVLLENPYVFANTIKRMDEDKARFVRVGDTQRNQNCYLAFSPVRKDSPKLAKIFSDGITAMETTGELKALMDKYGVE